MIVPSWMIAPAELPSGQLAHAPTASLYAQRVRHNVPRLMRDARRWLVHRGKVPHYVSGAPRSGILDSPEDEARFGTFDEALAAMDAVGWDGLGFALGDGWQGIDLDKVREKSLSAIAADLPGYVERSPSGKGVHAVGFGAPFDNMGSDGSGVEAYSAKRFFTVTGDEGRGEPTCIARFVSDRLEPLRRRLSSANQAASPERSTAASWDDLASALQAIPASCSRDEWIRVGMALKVQGEATGQAERALGMWRSWSKGDPNKYPGDRGIAQQWASFHGDKPGDAVGPASVFYLAEQRYGWSRPQPDASGMFTAVHAAPSHEPTLRALSYVIADELPAEFQAPDELIQGLLTVGDCSLWYGDSNAGKTFAVLDAACAVARGVPWMGRQTETGLVVYLAAESPSSVRSRVQAYQRHHAVRMPNLVIVQSPIDLFDGDADTGSVISLVRDLEAQKGQKCRLIIGDTLARLSAGANENAGQDMGMVVRRVDRIRSDCMAHVALIHHGGKDQTKGARGWSGIRAAVDTEIEVTDSPTGRCIEVTKQRDLATKGQRIGFQLHPLTLGLGKWGAPVTSCVVMPAQAATKQKGKPLAGCAKEVTRVVRGHPNGIMTKDIVRCLAADFNRTTVSRSINQLTGEGVVLNINGIIVPGGLFPVVSFEEAMAKL